jgi:hypothetical protein
MNEARGCESRAFVIEKKFADQHINDELKRL